METKVCSCCNLEKTIDFFNKDKKGKYGVSSKCKICKNNTNKTYRLENSMEIKSTKLKWYLANKEKTKQTCDNWKSNNIEKVKKYRQKTIKDLHNCYIKRVLYQHGFKNNQITPELIELKRITLKTTRLCRQLKN